MPCRVSRPARARGSKPDRAGGSWTGRLSRPARARGSKQFVNRRVHFLEEVAPRTGAWIETSVACSIVCCRSSRPARARGSKPAIAPVASLTLRSRPARARGSKQVANDPRTDSSRSRPARARGSKHPQSVGQSCAACRAPHGRVDRNTMNDAGDMVLWESRPARARGSKLDDAGSHRAVKQSRPARARGSKPDFVQRLCAFVASRPARARGSKPHPLRYW